MSIQDTVEKINPVRNREGSQRPSVSNGVKHFTESNMGKDILTIMIIILVGLGSFGLGRMSKTVNMGTSSTLQVTYDPTVTKVEANTVSTVLDTNKKSIPTSTSTGKSYFASNRGSKYYSLGCSGGKTLKEENKVWFSTKEEAEKAGYELSSACK